MSESMTVMRPLAGAVIALLGLSAPAWATYGGGACRYVVNVEDNGGDQSVGVDRFTIRVYSSSGSLIHQNTGLLGGGKLHVHPPS